MWTVDPLRPTSQSASRFARCFPAGEPSTKNSSLGFRLTSKRKVFWWFLPIFVFEVPEGKTRPVVPLKTFKNKGFDSPCVKDQQGTSGCTCHLAILAATVHKSQEIRALKDTQKNIKVGPPVEAEVLGTLLTSFTSDLTVSHCTVTSIALLVKSFRVDEVACCKGSCHSVKSYQLIWQWSGVFFADVLLAHLCIGRCLVEHEICWLDVYRSCKSLQLSSNFSKDGKSCKVGGL